MIFENSDLLTSPPASHCSEEETLLTCLPRPWAFPPLVLTSHGCSVLLCGCSHTGCLWLLVHTTPLPLRTLGLLCVLGLGLGLDLSWNAHHTAFPPHPTFLCLDRSYHLSELISVATHGRLLTPWLEWISTHFPVFSQRARQSQTMRCHHSQSLVAIAG